MKKKHAVASVVKELKPEALSAIRDVTGSEVKRLHPLTRRYTHENGVDLGKHSKEEKLHLLSTSDEGTTSKKTRTDDDHTEIPIPDEEDDLGLVQLPADLRSTSSDRTLIEHLELDESETRKRQAHALHDVPLGIKHTKYQVEQLPMITMYAATYPNVEGGKRREWFDKYQIVGLGALMNKVLKGVWVHSQPRWKFYDHERHKKCNRLTVMLTRDGQTSVKDDGQERECEKTAKEWCGITVCYHDKPSYDGIVDVMYLDTPIGLTRMALTHEELRNVTDVYQVWMNDVYELALKPNQKELNSKYFDPRERRQSAESDLAEWRQWIINQAVDLVPAAEEAKVPK